MGGLEQLVVMAVLHAGDEAYGARIWEEIRDRARRPVSLGAVYTTLARLEEKGHLRSRRGEPHPERGGRPRRYYAVESSGLEALRDALAEVDRMRAGIDLEMGPNQPGWAGGPA
ncbi:MAG: PadR family transcriptional regulator [Gemmatimonadota bacterium]